MLAGPSDTKPRPTIVVQITELGANLVSVNDKERSRAAQLLGEVTQTVLGLQVIKHLQKLSMLQVITLVPGAVQTEPAQEHVVQFLSSRLSDW